MACGIYLGLGSNIGDRLAHLQHAIREIKSFVKICQQSSVYETAPWGYPDQPHFLNQVIEISSPLEPAALFHALKRIEHKMGRQPSFRNGPRNIDLDILLFNDIVIDTPDLNIPHKEMHKRGFVLVPLVEIAPDLIHPILQKSISELKKGLNITDIYKIEEKLN